MLGHPINVSDLPGDVTLISVFMITGPKEAYAGLLVVKTFEGFWGQLKRSMDGTYHCVSWKYLQLYLNEFVYRYDDRAVPVFPVLIASAARRVQ